MDRTQQSPKVTLFSVLATLLVLTVNGQSGCDTHRFENNLAFTACSPLQALGSFLHWTYNEANGTVSIAFRHPGTSSSSWISWGLNPSGTQMSGTQALVAFTNSSGQFQAYTSPVNSYSTQLQRGTLSFGVSRVSATLVNGEATIFATLELPTNLITANQLWQVGPVVNGVPAKHQTTGDNMRSMGRVDFRTGQATAGGGGSGDRLTKRNTHGILNAVSWGVLMPLGAMMARYMKVFADPTWFYLHIAFQVSGYAIGVAGWATGIKLGNDSPGTSYSTHRNLGIALFTFATLQVFALLLRPKPDHKYRTYWNVYHHTVGYTTIVLSIVNIFKGFDILDPADKWRWAYIGILIFLGACVLILEPLTWFIVLRRKNRGGNTVAVPTSNKYSNGVNGTTTTGPHHQDA
ncbi:PREDICTED: cytochrome b561 and DOMON domain-containing protein At5g35735 [Camelina sativa]|uniref:Cytochrome b561 and DOMON domain-containing protein n=1 Tax=Camelina sativa TaxID=90675 RepID=A0ABM0V400_CAMSA|nr:PREDICTED: cytochrome b561 and DOMON domain-containing protein At5g35735 [Camelina sativa]